MNREARQTKQRGTVALFMAGEMVFLVPITMHLAEAGTQGSEEERRQW